MGDLLWETSEATHLPRGHHPAHAASEPLTEVLSEAHRLVFHDLSHQRAANGYFKLGRAAVRFRMSLVDVQRTLDDLRAMDLAILTDDGWVPVLEGL